MEVVGEAVFTIINHIPFATNICLKKEILNIVATTFPKEECLNPNSNTKECKQHFGLNPILDMSRAKQQLLVYYGLEVFL